MFPQNYMMNSNRNANDVPQNNTARPPEVREKIMSYEEKTVGSTQFFKCEACPYMALAEDDIKFHLFTEHPDLAKQNGLADNIQISCPGCTDSFSAEETLRNHLRNHHKMGIKDVKKMVKSLVQIALKDTKLKRDVINTSPPENNQPLDIRIPQVIEIPDAININHNLNNNSTLPKGVQFITVDELNKMSTPNFEQVDPKEIIQEASINIVYSNEVSQYVNVSNSGMSTSSCSMVQVSSVTPDLISSIQPRSTDKTLPQQSTSSLDKFPSPILSVKGRPKKHVTINNIPIAPIPDETEQPLSLTNKEYDETEKEIEDRLGILCGVNNCHFRMKSKDKLAYHRKCHRDGKFFCSEGDCPRVCFDVETFHTHLWKVHAVDMELPTCEICGFKTYKRYRLLNIHMKIHGKLRAYTCSICTRTFKTNTQLSKHKWVHKKELNPIQCPLCHLEFSCKRRLNTHTASVHDKYRPYKCTETDCDFTAAKKEALKLHARTHTGEKPYSCDECSFKCADHNSLRRHKKQHSTELPYKCKLCPYTAIQSTRLRSHMIIKHPTVNTDLHKCPYCRFKSLNKEKYVLHLTTHTDKEGIQLLIEMTKEKAKINSQKANWTITVPSDSDSQSSNQEVNKVPPNWTVKIPDPQNNQETNKTDKPWIITIPSQKDTQNITQEPNKSSKPNWMITIPSQTDTQNITQEPIKSSKPNWMINIPSNTNTQNTIQESTMNKPNWRITIPNQANIQNANQEVTKEPNSEQNQEVNAIDVETYDYDSLSENMPQDYSKTYTSTANNIQQTNYNNQILVQDLSKDENKSDCLMSESSNDTLLERHQYATQMPLQLGYENNQPNIRYIPNVSMNQNMILQNNSVPLSASVSPTSNNITNIMSNFPIRLPPQTNKNSNITLTPVDKISNPLTTKITGTIKPSQILPVPCLSNSPPVNFSTTPDDGAPRKKPKISVKSNLILKGPDRVNMFHSQQKMAFRQLEDSERFGCPVTFNNLITTQFMQLQPDPVLSESPNNILTYREPILSETSTPPVDTEINNKSQIFTFNQQMNVNQILLPPIEKIQTTNPSYIKLEGTIKQNTQSPSLERMCTANLLNNQALTRQYKASPPLEDMNKNMNEIKNEVKSDFYNQNLINEQNNPSILDQYLLDNLIGDQYTGHLDLSAVVLPEVLDDPQNDVIEIDENSDDTKMLPRYDMNFPLEPLFLMHNDFHFLENDVLIANSSEIPPVSEMNRMVSDVPLPKDTINVPSEGSSQNFPNFIEGKKDPMMNTSVRPTTNKINVKNIELMKN